MPKVLIIDDTNSALDLPRSEISSYCDVRFAGSAIIAIDLLSKEHYDVIIVNLDMESSSGSSILKKAKSLQSTKETPVIAITVNPNSAVSEKCLEIDGVEIFSSPVDKVLLSTRICEMTGTDRADAEIALKNSAAASEISEKKSIVMVVDDDDISLETIKVYLYDENYNVVAVNSGRAALDKFDEGIVPDVILLDVRMPEIDGVALFKRIVSNPTLKSIPVIFQTGISDVETVKECISIGTAGYIVKPVRKRLLLAKLESALSSTKERQHILVVEPDMVTLNIIKHHLQDSFKVSLEYSVQLALNFLSNQRPDLIILDDENPCAAYYKLNSRASDIPIALLTEECSDIAAIDKCISLGAVGIIKNIYDKNEVLSIVKKAL